MSFQSSGAANIKKDGMSADLASICTIAAAPLHLACPYFHWHVSV